ncbi:glutamate synthase-related protein [Streptomyces sp. NPDC002573]
MCDTNACPVGLATQDPRRARALNVHETSARVHRFQSATAQDHRFAGRM